MGQPSLGACLLSVASFLAAAPLLAQQETEPRRPADQIEEIVVTAEKRETAVQETPAAISAFTGADLEAAGIQDVEGLSFVVPNLHFGKAADGPDTFITIRGISTSGGDQAVAFHIDNIYQNQSRAAGISFYDVERVEVLRGPQGTLYGRNATGGVINVISKVPVDEFEAFGDVQFGTYSQIQTRAVVNVPLLEDRLFSRVSFFRETRDGYQRNNYTSVRSRDAQDADDTSIRAQLRFVPSEDVDFILRGTYTHLGGNGSGAKLVGDFPEEADTGPFGVQDIYRVCGKTSFSPCNNENPSDPRRVYLDDFPDQDLDSYAISGTLTWDLFDLPWLGDAQLTAIGSWQRSDGNFFLDADYSESFLVNAFTDFPKTRQYTAELRLASASGGPLEWLGGFFYLNETDEMNVDARSGLADLLLPGPTIEISAIQDSTFDSRSYAVFGNASYRLGEDTETIWDDLRLIGGLRYTYDKKEATRYAPLARIFVPDDPSFPGQQICTAIDEVCPVDVEDSDSWGELSGEAGIEWAWSLDNMAYLKVARGYKAGTIELGPPPNTPPGPLIGDDVTEDNPDPENLWAYEIGSKNRFLEDRLQANFAVFYYDYDDLQITQLIDDQEITENAAKATVWGAEAEFVALPLEGLLLTASFSYLSAELDEFISNDAANPVSLDPTAPNYDPSAFDCGRRDPCLDFGGNTMIRAPEYSMTLTGQYTWELGRWGTLTPRVQFYASDDVWYRPYNVPSTDKIGNYTKTDVRLTWVSEEGHVSVEGFVDNLFDEDVPQSVFVGSSLLGFPVQGVYDPPRTTGVRIGMRW